jgi:predicted phage terminase large subunit-like protein
MTSQHLAILEQLAVHEARKSFWAFRRFMHPKMKLGWWQREIARELQCFWNDFLARSNPHLVIEAPPQHGKSEIVTEFLCWVLGHNPDLKSVYASFSQPLGIRANLAVRRIVSSPRYAKVFPGTRIGKTDQDSDDGTAPRLNQSIIEFESRRGYFRNTTVRGSITGEGLDLGVIDDPIKGREEAGSKTVREATWQWFTDDFFTRFSAGAGLLAIMTRWHVDDPIGRLRDSMGDKLRVVSYPAIAVRQERFRNEGEALFPEHKPLDFLLARKAVMASVNWEALYQQNPQIIGGEIIRGAWFGRYKVPPRLKFRMIFADTAQKTAERNDFSVLECWGKGDDGRIYLLDMIRGKWEGPELKRRTIEFWNKHAAADVVVMGQLRQLKVEDAASGTGLVQDIKASGRIPIAAIKRTKDKYTRCLDVLGHIEAGYVMLPEAAPFTSDFISEAESFTADDSHLHDDQLDPMFDACNEMLASNTVAELWSKQA